MWDGKQIVDLALGGQYVYSYKNAQSSGKSTDLGSEEEREKQLFKGSLRQE
jgi:hypothetical protein